MRLLCVAGEQTREARTRAVLTLTNCPSGEMHLEACFATCLPLTG